jgi:hypothetical protein
MAIICRASPYLLAVLVDLEGGHGGDAGELRELLVLVHVALRGWGLDWEWDE